MFASAHPDFAMSGIATKGLTKMTASNPCANGAPFLAADVGGTHVRLGIMRGAGTTQPIEMLACRTYRCADRAALADFIAEFLAGHDGTHIKCGVIASAGYALEDGTVIATNLPWPLSMRETRERLGFTDLRLVNDFEALAYAAATVPAADTFGLCGPMDAVLPGPVLVLGPGTGLGAALWLPAQTNRAAFVLPTEAGQAALAAGNDAELKLLAHALKKQSHVSIEYAVSGPGIVRLYNDLCEMRGVQAMLHTPVEIAQAAQTGSNALAVQALEMFCGILGSAVGDMALNYSASTIRLAGGFLPRICDFLFNSSFSARLLDKGQMRAVLQRIPVRLVEHGQLGVVGAAQWYLQLVQNQ
jgi:glucokinase